MWQVVEGLRALLRAFPAVDLPQDFTLVRSRWGSDPLFRGSYSYIPTGCTTTSISALQEPLRSSDGLPRVLLAGEATHAQYFGTVHGAMFSGERAAQQVLDSFSGLNK